MKKVVFGLVLFAFSLVANISYGFDSAEVKDEITVFDTVENSISQDVVNYDFTIENTIDFIDSYAINLVSVGLIKINQLELPSHGDRIRDYSSKINTLKAVTNRFNIPFKVGWQN